MALSFTRLLVGQQSVLQNTSLCAGAQSVRWRVRKRKLWLEKDKKDKSWMEPLFEYRREKEATASQTTKPAMLHVVHRTQKMSGRPWWEKIIITKLGLDGRQCEAVIHKNTPETNKLLREVKHLISVQPLSLPDGFPDDPRDYKHTVLTSRGELRMTRTVRPVEDLGEEQPSQQEQDKWKLTTDTIKKDLRRKLDNYEVREEYVKPFYVYTMNQDGNEFRYTTRFNTTKPKNEK